MTLIAYVSFLLRLWFWSIIYPDTSIMKKTFLQFSPKHIKWSQFGRSSKRIFSKKLSKKLCPLDPRWGLRPQTPVIGSRSRARHGIPNPPFTNPAYTPE